MSIRVDTNRLRDLVDQLCEARASGKMPSTILSVLAEHELRAALSELDHLRTERNLARAFSQPESREPAQCEKILPDGARIVVKVGAVTTSFLEELLRLRDTFQGSSGTMAALLDLLIERERAALIGGPLLRMPGG